MSLLTNIPVGLAIAVARHRLEADTSLGFRMNLRIQELVQLMEDATYLCFLGHIFQRMFGTAVGSPVSVSVANSVIEDVEEQTLTIYL